MQKQRHLGTSELNLDAAVMTSDTDLETVWSETKGWPSNLELELWDC